MDNTKLLLFNPAISSMNEGDSIIFDSAKKQIDSLFPYFKKYELPTQMPVSKKVLNWYGDVKLRFVCGTNLLKNGMFCEWGRIPHFKKYRQWDIDLGKVPLYRPVILLGCGWQKYEVYNDGYSKKLWNELLSKDYKHSVRDEYTKNKLAEIGITNTINTGCPTLWELTKDHCSIIPTNKAQNVVTTITDYSKNVNQDQKMLDTLSVNYKNIYIWLQGYNDADYIKKLTLPDNSVIVSGGLEAYDRLLASDLDIEFVGTRLHGGIRALQKKRRTTFIAVDNRTIEMGKNFGLDYIKRDDCDCLDTYLNQEHPCHITIPEKEIDEFKAQFRRR